MFLYKEFVKCPGNHNQSRTMGKLLVVCAHGMFQRMFGGSAAKGHHCPGKVIGERHPFPGFHVVPVPDGAR